MTFPGYNVPPHKQPLLGPYSNPLMNIPGLPGTQQYPGGFYPFKPHRIGSSNFFPPISAAADGTRLTYAECRRHVRFRTCFARNLATSGNFWLIFQTQHLKIAVLQLQVMPMYQEVKAEDPSQVKFAGPIPPPAKLPPKWKCAKDKYGRPYYYHVKLRKSQWEPPLLPEPTLEDCKEFIYLFTGHPWRGSQ